MAVQLITKAAYARHRWCDEKAVRKAMDRAMFEIWREVRDRQSAAPAVHTSALAKGGA